jgi:purine-binding chemotaxis protein CheW
MNKIQSHSEKAGEAIDWEEIHRRLEATGRILEHIGERSAEEKKKILAARTKALAAEARGEENAAESVELVEFLLAHEKYGIESGFVSEVLPLKDITPVPCTPVFVSGIINVRGRILSVVDIKKFFGLPEKGLGDLNRVIVLCSGDRNLGILADAILGVHRISVNGLQKPAASFTGIRAAHLKGVTATGMAVLDAEKILSDAKMTVNEEV